MKTPTVIVYYDGDEQDYVQMTCDRSNGVVKMELTYNKQMGSDHVLKVYVRTGQRTLNAFSFGEKTIRLIDYNPTFDGFYDSATRQTKQFRLGDFNTIKQLVQHDEQQLRKLADQVSELNIVIKEWVDEAPPPRYVTDGPRRGRLQTDGGRVQRDGVEMDGCDESFTDSCKPVGYETNVLNKNKYVDAKGKEGPVLAEIKIKFVSKQFINVV
ncbi:p22.2 [Anticarsia gemmatalis nucleopolyhedrovirus]|uniref:p22.2 n=1 Tax=Anticarsia gemmatalis multiple nucleopolyhedrovirus TaxID=268591 RepID=A0A0S3IX92_9ABAC|nr:p22.2 [Anticarsia gemmatalis nucleopolyhedrovirus]ABI13913.1 p22.2 [Anticarsia gemmatalis multiple nucleopolyhedrovirus]ALR69835.1 p22.2 [Anticarsia gemmatalis multiple nucleopolyhedrovirus]ALR70620.1 p22.2 [Anticarsia gemmatalis multiple nucleopolyhedrovirus]ALR71876.1 p22.2 [Anticarsia gemmatalis multiple nucleopolyhedrovirus]ALR72034.1 p22.2 [Anticarsia gemmatalis multiple nucleopolyhedrovirus]